MGCLFRGLRTAKSTRGLLEAKAWSMERVGKAIDVARQQIAPDMLCCIRCMGKVSRRVVEGPEIDATATDELTAQHELLC